MVRGIFHLQLWLQHRKHGYASILQATYALIEWIVASVFSGHKLLQVQHWTIMPPFCSLLLLPHCTGYFFVDSLACQILTFFLEFPWLICDYLTLATFACIGTLLGFADALLSVDGLDCIDIDKYVAVYLRWLSADCANGT